MKSKYSIAEDKNIDREILLKLSDKDFVVACNSSRYLRDTVCDENFFKRRLSLTYPDTLNFKSDHENWKQYYLSTIFYIAKMKEKHGYSYTFGNPKTQYKIIENLIDTNANTLLFKSAVTGELSLVIEAVKRGANVRAGLDYSLREASYKGHLEVIK